MVVSPRPSWRAQALTWTGRGWSQVETTEVGGSSMLASEPHTHARGSSDPCCLEVVDQPRSTALLGHPRKICYS